MKKWIFMLTIAVVLFGSVIGFNIFKIKAISAYMANMPEPELPVTTITAETGNWTPSIEAIGFIEPNQGVMITTEAAGVVQEINFDSGAQIKQGQPLLSLNSKVEQASLRSVQARLPAAEAKYKRYRGLHNKGSLSKESFDEAKASYYSLAADIESLKASIERRTITAPFDGVVGLRNVYLGQYIQPGIDLVRLEDTTLMKLRFTVPQTEISRIRLDQSVEIFVDAYPETSFLGQISAIEPAVNYQSGLIQVQADIPNNSGQLRSGMFARAHIIQPTLTEQMILPQTAINYTLYGNSVYLVEDKQESITRPVLNKDQGALAKFAAMFKEPERETLEVSAKRVRQVVVQLGENKGTDVHVLDGIKPGDVVVTSGQIRLSNGAKVKVVESDTLTAPDETPML